MEDLPQQPCEGSGLPRFLFLCHDDGDMQRLFVIVILAHHRRRLVHFNVTEHPTAEWTTQRVLDTFPWDEAPRCVLRDRDPIYSALFRQRVRHMRIEDVVVDPRSPWQNSSVERLIGSIRREGRTT